MPPVYRAAIIGTGRIGNSYDDEVVNSHERSFFQGAQAHSGLYTIWPVNHADAYLSTPGFQLVAAANRSADRLRAFGEQRGVRALYTDLQALLREEAPDVVSVCTQSPEKVEVVLAAAETGVRAIIVEKALATSMAEADAMLNACREHNTLLVVNHPYRFSPQLRAAKQALEAGELGRPGTVAAYASGGMLHVGTHTFDLLRYLIGDVRTLTATIPNYVSGQDLPATGTLNFVNGVTGFFDHCQQVQPGYEVRGTRGRVVVSSLVGDGWLYQHQSLDPTSPRRYPEQLQMRQLATEPHTMSMIQRMLHELHDSLTIGAPFCSTGEDGAAALELGLACHLAHREQATVTLPLADRTLRVVNR